VHLAGDVALESGVVLRDVRQAYYLDGALNAARDNLVVVFHALTGSADAAGDWWRDVVGPGRAVDTGRLRGALHQPARSCYGSTGPADPGAPPLPARHAARHGAARSRGSSTRCTCGRWRSRWAARSAGWWRSSSRPPSRRSPAAPWCSPPPPRTPPRRWGGGSVQRRAIAVGGDAGLEVARMVAMMTYRTADELEARFGRRDDDAGGGFAVERYLSRHGERLRARFDLHSYLALLAAMDAHDVAGAGRRGRRARAGGQPPRGGGHAGRPPLRRGRRARVDGGVRAAYRELRSVTGHDAFLVEHAQVSAISPTRSAERRGRL
jgi:homoserine O-acetyltransferase